MIGYRTHSHAIFKRYNSKNPEKGGAKKINTGMTNQERDEQIKGLRIRFGPTA